MFYSTPELLICSYLIYKLCIYATKWCPLYTHFNNLLVMRKCTLRLDDDLHDDVIEYCDRNGYKMIGLIRVLLRERLDAEE